MPVRDHLRNMLVLSAVESFWGLGMNLVSMGTVLPVFLEGLGASNGTIALIPALSALGMGLPQVFSGLFVRRRRGLKGWVLWMHVLCPLPLALVGAGLVAGWPPPVLLVLLGWGAFYALIGILYPVWLEYMGRLLDPARRGRALGFIFLVQTAAGALGVSVAAGFLKVSTAPVTYALLFGMAWAVLAGGSLCFLGTREGPAPPREPAPMGLRAHAGELYGLLRELPWMAAYLPARWLVRGAYPLILHFYAVYAVAARGVSPAEAAAYGLAGLIAQAGAGAVGGYLGDRWTHKVPVVAGQIFLLGACALVWTPLPPWGFFGVAALTGAFLGTEYTCQVGWLMDLAPAGRRQSLLALAGFLLTPAAVLAPLAGGLLMDRFGFRAVAAGVGAAVALAMVLELVSLPGRAAPRE